MSAPCQLSSLCSIPREGELSPPAPLLLAGAVGSEMTPWCALQFRPSAGWLLALGAHSLRSPASISLKNGKKTLLIKIKNKEIAGVW